MAGPGDGYRLKAADMFAMAEQNEGFRQEFENLARAFLRLADQADRNLQLGLPLDPDDSAAHQRQQSSESLEERPQQQQQQQVQLKNKPAE
jgi:hypothetical protein